MRLLFVAFCLMASGLLMTSGAVAQSFLSVADDIPLMSGLSEDMDAALVFDSPDGRIVEAAAVGVASASLIRAFYGDTLPQLGWQEAEQGRFVRDSETLTIEIAETHGQRLVRFRFAPSQQP